MNLSVRRFAAGFMIAHGLIHAIGVTVALDLGEIDGFMGTTTLDVGGAGSALGLSWLT